MTRTRTRPGTSAAAGDADDEPLDLRANFNCPFLIRNEIEGAFYERWMLHDISPAHGLDWNLLSRLNCSNRMKELLNVLGLYKYAMMDFTCSQVLTREFLTALEVPTDLSYCEFRMKEETHRLSVATVSRILGFHPPSVGEPAVPNPSVFNPNAAWTELTGFHNWATGGMSASFLRDNVLSILHKFISYNIFGKEEANKINLQELYLLHCAATNTRVCAGYYLLNTFKGMITAARHRPALPLVPAAFGRHLRLFDPDSVPVADRVDTATINFGELKNARIITSDHRWYPSTRRPTVKKHVNELAAAAAHPPHEPEGARVLDDADFEDQQMEDAFAAGPSSSTRSYGPGSSSGDIDRLSSNVQALQTDFGEFRTDFRAFTSDFGTYNSDFQSFRQNFRTYTNDFRSFRQDYGEFRTDITQRQTRVEQQIVDTHTLVTEQNRMLQFAQDQVALHYQQVMENNCLVANLNR